MLTFMMPAPCVSNRARTRSELEAREAQAAAVCTDDHESSCVSESEDTSSDGVDRVAEFERRMAAEERGSEAESDGVVFEEEAHLQRTPGEVLTGARTRALEQQGRVWALVSERWAQDERERHALAAMEVAIREEALKLPLEALDEFGELSRVPALVQRRGQPGRLLIGSEDDARSAELLASLGVTSVLCCVEELVSPRRQDLYRDLAITHLHVPMRDDMDEDLASHLAPARKFLAEQLGSGATVLVHCFIGQNRSCAVALAYLCLDEKMDLVTAVRAVAAARGLVLGSGSFQLQLVRLCGA